MAVTRVRAAIAALCVAFAALPAVGASWFNVDPFVGAQDNATRYEFAAADGTGFSSIRGLGPQCRTVAVGFADGAGGDATVHSCSDVACTESKAEVAFVADGEAVFVPRFRRLRVERVAVGAGTSILEISCGGNVARSAASVPTGTGFRHMTAGVEDAAAKLVDTADVNDDQITYAKVQNVVADDRLLGRVSGANGNIEEIAATAPLGLAGGSLLLTQNAGTDVTADLEEETHAAEHSQAAADPVTAENLASACLSGETLEGDGTGGVVCGTDGNSVVVTLDFGLGGSDIASVVVTGQAWVAAGTEIACAPTMVATADRAEGAEDAVIEGLVVAAHTRVAATGFTLTGAPRFGHAIGKYAVHCLGV
jgi:hypothetical protein